MIRVASFAGVAVVAVVAIVAHAGCAPKLADERLALDRVDGERLTAQLTALPGVSRAEVLVRRTPRDPFGSVPPIPGIISMVIVTDDRADRLVIEQTARSLASALPELATAHREIHIVTGVTRSDLAKVGPFEVAASSARPLRWSLIGGLAAIAGLALWLRAQTGGHRRGTSAQ